MSRRLWKAIVVGCGMSIGAGCSGNPPRAAAASSASAHGAAHASTGTACDRKLLTTEDAAGILNEPATSARSIPGAPESCEFTSASSSSIEVTLRAGGGKVTVDIWKSGRMPAAAVPVSGVGDEAVWVDELHEIVAEKNDVLCDIQVFGLARGLLNAPTAVREARIGGLCNTIFAAIH